MFATFQRDNQIEIDESPSLYKADFPFTYQSIQISTGFRPIGFRYSKYITEISAHLDGQEILVCGESESQDIDYQKAFSELIERSALIKYGSLCGAKTSNGWAAHPQQVQVRMNAILEIVERDAVLAHWYSRTPFIEIPYEEFPLDVQAWVQCELSQSEFPILRLLFSTMGIGPSVTCILMNKFGFGVSAHATKETISGSISSAIAEACRAAHASIRRSHWKDTMRLNLGEPGAVDPSAHALYYAYHEKFPEWMFGNKQSYFEAKTKWYSKLNTCLEDNPFCYQKVLCSPIHVGFATHPKAFELKWEATDLKSVVSENGFERLKIKPEAINGKPHIVS
jgi:hypothetical protein